LLEIILVRHSLTYRFVHRISITLAQLAAHNDVFVGAFQGQFTCNKGFAMSTRYGMLSLLFMAVFVVPSDAATAPQRTYSLSVRLLEGDATPKILVDQTVVASGEGKVHFFSGGEISEDGAIERLEFGTRIVGQICESQNNLQQVSLKIEFSRRLQSEESDSPVVSGDWIALRTQLKEREKTRIYCGGKRWCELMIE
jgi:hypothetical protein